VTVIAVVNAEVEFAVDGRGSAVLERDDRLDGRLDILPTLDEAEL
jgi:hypothetical protein